MSATSLDVMLRITNGSEPLRSSRDAWATIFSCPGVPAGGCRPSVPFNPPAVAPCGTIVVVVMVVGAGRVVDVVKVVVEDGALALLGWSLAVAAVVVL
jgi:hypothetical protein